MSPLSALAMSGKEWLKQVYRVSNEDITGDMDRKRGVWIGKSPRGYKDSKKRYMDGLSCVYMVAHNAE